MRQRNRWSARALLPLALAGVLLGSILAISPASAAPALARPFAEAVGTRVPTGLQGQRAYDRWLGRTLDTTLLYAFEANQLWGITKDGAQASGRAVDGQHTAVITVGLVPKSLDDPLKTGTDIHVSNIRRGLAGEFDGMYETMARRLVERGLHQPWADGSPKVVIRLGHEHNLLHTEWHSGGIEADWARLYRRVVGKMEAITGPQLRFEWNSSFTGSPASLLAAYPGDDVVDVIGVDFYDRIGYSTQSAFPAATGTTARTQAEREASWSKVRNGSGSSGGLQWFADFARSRGKPMGVSEWGLFAKQRDAGWDGGGDNPFFIQKVHEFFTGVAATGHLAYLLYFEADPNLEGSTSQTNTFHKLAPGDAYEPISVSPGSTDGARFPEAAKTYLRLFGGAGGGTSPTVAPTTSTTVKPTTSTTVAPTTSTTVKPTTSTTVTPSTPTTPTTTAPVTTAPGNGNGNGRKENRTVQAAGTTDDGYWLVTAGGDAHAFGNRPQGVATGAGAPIAAAASTPSKKGYWTARTDGSVQAFGDAPAAGDLRGTRLAAPVVGFAPTPSGQGYWLLGRDGGIFSFGDAAFHGSTGALRLNQPIVGMAAAPGGGYWFVAADGGIFSFGSGAPFLGSMGATELNSPIVGMAATPSGRGYWLVAADGGIFSFGDATFQGSTGGTELNSPIVGMTATRSGQGYWFVAADGGIFSFGDAAFVGSLGGSPLPTRVVAIA